MDWAACCSTPELTLCRVRWPIWLIILLTPLLRVNERGSCTLLRKTNSSSSSMMMKPFLPFWWTLVNNYTRETARKMQQGILLGSLSACNLQARHYSSTLLRTFFYGIPKKGSRPSSRLRELTSPFYVIISHSDQTTPSISWIHKALLSFFHLFYNAKIIIMMPVIMSLIVRRTQDKQPLINVRRLISLHSGNRIIKLTMGMRLKYGLQRDGHAKITRAAHCPA